MADLNLAQAISGASGLLQGLDIIPPAQSSAPAPSQAAGYTAPAAVTETGGAGPSTAPTASRVPTWAWVAGGAGALVLIFIIARR